MESLVVWAPATPVRLKLLNMDGIINAIQVSAFGQIYLISYFNAGARTEVWMHEHEFDVADEVKRMTLGFRRCA